jgi:hypothetical protein
VRAAVRKEKGRGFKEVIHPDDPESDGEAGRGRALAYARATASDCVRWIC